MALPDILLLAMGLGMDALAVSVAASLLLGGATRRQLFRMSFHFGLFQAGMPVLGWALGRSVAARAAAWDHWVAFGLLAFIGGRALWSAARQDPGKPANRRDPTRGLRLVGLSVATSIDALAAGLSFAMLGVAVWLPSAVIGLAAALMSLAGMLAGRRLGPRFGRGAEAAGGIVLVGLGVKILVEHLAAG